MKPILLILPILLFHATLQAGDTATSARPNVVVILTDDLGWGSVGCYGANPELVQTPNIDRLAREGRRFTDANTTSSVCSPTRYAMMTGRYCWRTSLKSEVLGTTAPLHIETTRLTMASMLKAQGYNCAAIGKWHLGYGTADRCDFTKELKPGPLEIGFDYHFGVPSNHGDLSGVYVENHWVYGLNKESPGSPSPPYVTQKQRTGQAPKTLDLNAPKRIDEEVMSMLTDKTVEWIEQQSAEKPFFVFFTPVAVHNPITPSRQTAGQSKGGAFCDFLHDLDLSVGRVLDTLEKKGLAKNTLVLFTSDNGGVNKPNGDTPQNVAQRAGLKPVGPFRGGKHDVWEGGFRVPYLVRWPGHVPAGTVCDETVSIVDTLASLSAIVGAKLPPVMQGAEDSFDISSAWLGQEHRSPLRPDLIVHSADGNFAIRKDGWKWIEGIPADDVKPAARKARADQMTRMLLQLRDDIAESKDVVSQHEPVARDLEKLLHRYRDGGYSRELPPADAKPMKPPVADLPPISSWQLLDLSSFRGANWKSRDDAMFGKADDKGSPLAGPVSLGDGVLEFQVLLGDANRHSLRIHTAESTKSFRVVLSGSQIEVALNPGIGEPSDKAISLAKTKVKYTRGEWQTMRLTFAGEALTVQCAGAELTARNPIFAKRKEQAGFIAFAGEVGVKQVRISAAK